MRRLLLAGEGNSELGKKGLEESRRGVLEALLAKIHPGGYEIAEAVAWDDVHKIVPKVPGRGDDLTVQRLVLRARSRGYDAVVFVRDRDGDRRREKAIERAIREFEPERGRGPSVLIGGVAIEQLEAWLLALQGCEGSEVEPDPVGHLEGLGVPPKKSGPMRAFVERSKLKHVAKDARSLRLWLRRAFDGLKVRPPPFLR